MNSQDTQDQSAATNTDSPPTNSEYQTAASLTNDVLSEPPAAEAVAPASLPVEQPAAPVYASAPVQSIPPAELAVLLGLVNKSLERMDELEEQIGIIPRQVTQLGNRIGGMASSVTEPRVKALLLDLLRVHDLIDQFIRSTAALVDGEKNSPAQGYQLLQREVRQILMLNGLVEIPTDGPFNPEIHRAMRRVPCDEPAKASQIKVVLKPGFRSEQGAILRYAEVEVWHFQAAAAGAPQAAQSATQSNLPAAGVKQTEGDQS